MEANNYTEEANKQLDADILASHLASGTHPQIHNVAEIIQRVRPDIILLNEFDYIADLEKGIKAFIKHYLSKPHNGAAAIDYRHCYVASVNTGEPSPFDLDRDGTASGTGSDAWGYGLFPGHYGMVLLSRYPIDFSAVRTFRMLRWSTMPGAREPRDPTSGERWYSDEQWRALRLSSKSHWDIPVIVEGERLHVLASHPTPPVFDGEENRNGLRNFDEIRFWADYVSGTARAQAYIVDDNGGRGGLPEHSRFVILGDLNAGVTAGEGHPEAINQLLLHPLVNGSVRPVSEGAREQFSELEDGETYTASWANRVDYVLPSRYGLLARDNGVFWPKVNNPLHRLVASREDSSDHRLVWQDLVIVVN